MAGALLFGYDMSNFFHINYTNDYPVSGYWSTQGDFIRSNGIYVGAGFIISSDVLAITYDNQQVFSFAIPNQNNGYDLYFISLSAFHAVTSWAQSGTGIYNYNALTATSDVYLVKSVTLTTLNSAIPIFNSLEIAIADFKDSTVTRYPIYYSHSVGCTITGQADAPSGQDIVVTVNVQSGYQFKGASGVRIIDALGDNVPFIVNGNQFSFTMPQF